MKHLFTGLAALATSLAAFAQPDCSQIIQASFTSAVQGNIVVVTNTSFSQFPQATTYQWAFGDGTVTDVANVTHIYDQPGTYQVCLYAIVENCVDTVCHEVEVGGGNPCSVLADVVTNLVAQQGGVNFAYGNVPQYAHTMWYFGDGTSSDEAQGFHQYQEPGTYTVCLWTWFIIEGTTDTCSSETCDPVIIEGGEDPCEGLEAGFFANPSPNGVQFSNGTTGTGFSTTWSWTFGDGTTSNDAQPFHEYPEPGGYLVCLTAISIYEQQGGGVITCLDSVCQEVVIPGEGSPCDGLNAAFNPVASGLSVNIQNAQVDPGWSYSWSFGDGTIGDGPNPFHVYDEPGEYQICLIVGAYDPIEQDSCFADYCSWVMIAGDNPCDTIQACFTWTGTGSSVFFDNCSSINGFGPFYQWDFGDGTESDAISPTHIFQEPGTYTVCLTGWLPNSPDSCSSTVCQVVVIGNGGSPCDSLNAEFTAWPGGLGVNFQNAVIDPSWSYQWYFDDGTEGQGPNPFHIYPDTGWYVVCLVVGTYDPLAEDSCFAEYCSGIQVGGDGSPCDSLSADFWWQQSGGPTNIFYSANSGSASHWLWTFGDGASSDNGPQGTHEYAEPGTYQLCLTLWYAIPGTQDTCIADHCEWITIGGLEPCDGLQAGFQANVGDATVWFSNSTTGTGFQTTWHWDFGDGTTSSDAQPSHIFPGLDSYLVCLTVTSLYEQQGGGVITCQDSTCQIVVTGGGSPCDSLSAEFWWQQSGGPTNIVYSASTGLADHWLWTFGDGTSSDNGPQGTHEYAAPGTYQLCLTVWYAIPGTQDTCIADHCEWITVLSGDNPCDSSFTTTFTWTDNGDGEVAFHATSEPMAMGYTWYFGDGTTGDGTNIEHHYAASGEYHVCLSAWFWVEGTQDTCWTEHCQWINVSGGGAPCDGFEASFEWTDQFNGSASFYGFTAPSANGYLWSFGDGTEGDSMNTAHEYAEPGEYFVCLSAWYWNQETQDTCWAEQCEWIFITGEGGPCDSLEAHFVWEPAGQGVFFFQDASFTNGQDVSYFWSFGDGQFSDDADPAHTFPEPGQYQVCLTITALNSPDPCSSTTCQIITVSGTGSPCDLLNPEFTVSASGLVAAMTAGFNPPGTSYEWLFGDGTFGDGANTTHTYAGPGEYQVCLIVGTYDPLAEDSCFEDHCVWITVGGGNTPCDSLWTADFEFGQEGSVYTFYNTSSTQGAEVSTHWTFGDGGIGDGSQTVHTYASSGQYTVCMTITGIIPGTEDSCHVVICHTIEVSVGIGDLSGTSPINAWPQPFEDVLQLEGADLMGSTRYTLFDMTGRIVDYRASFAQGRVSLEYPHLSPGTYVLSLRTDAMDRSLRVVKR